MGGTMITADLTDERAFAEINRLCHAGLDPETLLRRVAEPLGRAVPFEGYAAITIDPLSGLPTGLVSNEEMGGKEGARFFVEHVYFEDDVLEFNWMVRNRLPAGLLSEATNGKLRVTGSCKRPPGWATSCAARLARAHNFGADYALAERRESRTSPLGRSPSCERSPHTWVQA